MYRDEIFLSKESKKEILDELNTTTSGLNSNEVEKRPKEKHGLNVCCLKRHVRVDFKYFKSI